MGLPFTDREYNFGAYRDFMRVIPSCFNVYITETNQGDKPWLNYPNSQWIQRAYAEIDWWNGNRDVPIEALILYRWTGADWWRIDDKAEVIKDFQAAMHQEYLSPSYDLSLGNDSLEILAAQVDVIAKMLQEVMVELDKIKEEYG